MVYTQQRRRAMNKVVRSLYPDINFQESANGIPVMQCSKLPENVRRVDNADDLFQAVDSHCVRTNEYGLVIQDFSKALPVFISSMELSGRDVRHFYRVNYVSVSELSKSRAAQYISEGKLYAAL